MAEESTAPPPKQLSPRTAAAAADDDVPTEPMAKVSRTHQGPLSQHTNPGQEEVRSQQSLSQEAVGHQLHWFDEEREKKAAQSLLMERVARAGRLEQEAQRLVDLAPNQTQRVEAEQTRQQRELELNAVKEEFLLSCLPSSRQQEERSVPQRQADEESTSSRHLEKEQMAREHARALHEQTRNQERDEADRRQRDQERLAEEQTARQEESAKQLEEFMKARDARVEMAHKLAKEEENKQLAIEEAAAFKQRVAEEEDAFKADWGAGDEEELQAAKREEEAARTSIEEARRAEEARQQLAALQVKEREEEAKVEATEQASNRTNLRRFGGLPTSLIVERNGDLFASKGERHSRFLKKVFEVRLGLCHYANLGSEAVLSVSMQKEGQTMLFQDWVASAAGQRKLHEAIWIKISNTPCIIT